MFELDRPEDAAVTTNNDDVLIGRIPQHGDRIAVIDPEGEHSFATIHDDAVRIATGLLAGRASLDGRRVAILCRPGRDVVGALLGCWLAGGLAVPLHPDHPLPELHHAVTAAGVELLVHSEPQAEAARALATDVTGLQVIAVEAARSTTPLALDALPQVDPADAALMVFTSGTTGRPKGAVHTHAGLATGIADMIDVWRWTGDDRIVLVLPLNHVHGLVNVTLTALWAGATCEAPGRFDATATWERFASGEVTLFMAVPTIYARLVAAWDAADEATRRRWSDGARSLRLMVSGSAALPVATLDRWEAVTGHRLLERYGMTELGMALTNSIEQRVPGHVGEPFPHVEVRLVDESGRDIDGDDPGELWVRGASIFAGYWDRPDATAEAFTDGWFRTGDIAVHDEVGGYRLLGRASVDIIKTGGEKVSALEIEEVFRTHPAVEDCAVVGVDDPEWGQRVAIAIIARDAGLPSADELRAWGRERLATAKVPSRWLTVEELPRNALGKVTKRQVTALFET